MATTKTETIDTPVLPSIQIDDEVREMTEEEFAAYQEMTANAPTFTE
jgi:hypothetical protein